MDAMALGNKEGRKPYQGADVSQRRPLRNRRQMGKRIEGKISDERFVKMNASYEEEQHTLESRVAELKKLIAFEKESSINVDRFLNLVRKYTDVKELNAEIIREFVEKIYVHQIERIDGQKVQRIRIVWNCIGEFTPPALSENKKSE